MGYKPPQLSGSHPIVMFFTYALVLAIVAVMVMQNNQFTDALTNAFNNLSAWITSAFSATSSTSSTSSSDTSSTAGTASITSSGQTTSSAGSNIISSSGVPTLGGTSPLASMLPTFSAMLGAQSSGTTKS